MLTPSEVGVDVRTFKQIKMKMLCEGTFDPNLWERLDSYQKYWVNETKKTIRDLSKSEKGISQ